MPVDIITYNCLGRCHFGRLEGRLLLDHDAFELLALKNARLTIGEPPVSAAFQPSSPSFARFTVPEQPSKPTTHAKPLEVDLASEMTPHEQAEARRYGRISLACSLADSAVDLVYLGVMTFVVAIPLDRWLAKFPALSGSCSYWRLIALLLIVFVFHVMVSAPLSFFSGFVVEHWFGLSRQTRLRWLRNWCLNNGLALAFSLIMFVALFAIIWNTGPYWWLIAAGAFFVVNVILGQAAPVLIMPLFHKIERLNNGEIEDRMARLAEGTGLTIEGVYRLGLSADTSKANAMLAGLGPTRRVLMGDTLLDQFSTEFIDLPFGDAINNPRLTLVSTNDLSHLSKKVRPPLHSINQVRSIKRTDQHLRITELQLVCNVFSDLR